MKRNLALLVMVLIAAGGCSTAAGYKKYIDEEARKGESTVVTSPLSLEETHDQVFDALWWKGYIRTIYMNKKEGIYVFTKDPARRRILSARGTTSHVLILKLTPLEAGGTRVDLVNRSALSLPRKEVAEDIQDLRPKIPGADPFQPRFQG